MVGGWGGGGGGGDEGWRTIKVRERGGGVRGVGGVGEGVFGRAMNIYVLGLMS